jgi:hypothetical protein
MEHITTSMVVPVQRAVDTEPIFALQSTLAACFASSEVENFLQTCK